MGNITENTQKFALREGELSGKSGGQRLLAYQSEHNKKEQETQNQ